jgi:hypothetical protein
LTKDDAMAQAGSHEQIYDAEKGKWAAKSQLKCFVNGVKKRKKFRIDPIDKLEVSNLVWIIKYISFPCFLKLSMLSMLSIKFCYWMNTANNFV